MYQFSVPITDHKGFNKFAMYHHIVIAPYEYHSPIVSCDILLEENFLEKMKRVPILLMSKEAVNRIMTSVKCGNPVYMYRFFYKPDRLCSVYFYEADADLMVQQLLYSDHIGPNLKTWDIHRMMGKVLDFGWNEYRQSNEQPYLGYRHLEFNFVNEGWRVNRKKYVSEVSVKNKYKLPFQMPTFPSLNKESL